jgi:hypothetical protein
VLSTPPGFSLYPNPGYFPGIELYGAAGSLTVKTNACDGSQPPREFQLQRRNTVRVRNSLRPRDRKYHR